MAKQEQVNPLLGNIEAMVVTDVSPDGRLRVLPATDHNTGEAQITRLYRLAVRLPSRSSADRGITLRWRSRSRLAGRRGVLRDRHAEAALLRLPSK